MKRRRAALYLMAISFLFGLESSVATPRKNVHPFPAAVGLTSKCKGCSCKCGPGYRLLNTNCASWEQHWKFMKTGYPAGTVDEIDLQTTDVNPLCPPELIKEKRTPSE